jgi:N-carbamoylputrescine amidase
MTRLKVAVCESPAELLPGSADWNELCRLVSRGAPDFFLINELPFGAWIASGNAFHAQTWRDCCALHNHGTRRFAELGAAVVAGSRPGEHRGRRVNEGFIWTKNGGASVVHTKQYFPDEKGYYEKRWFAAGHHSFQVTSTGPIRGGFLICTEVMFNEHAREYGRSGANVILVPRAVGKISLKRWLVAMRMAAIVSGAYVLSSNRHGVDYRGQEFGGAGWIIDPNGDVVAETSEFNPVAFHEIDTDLVSRAQKEYPCYIEP